MQKHHRSRWASRVVIVEPHDDSRELYAEYFTWAGLFVKTVPTAAEALRLTLDATQDAVVTCLRLRGMDGFALCNVLRAVPWLNRIPVIALSTCHSDHERAVDGASFAAVLMKPCLPEALLKSLLWAIAARQSERRIVKWSLPTGSIPPPRPMA